MEQIKTERNGIEHVIDVPDALIAKEGREAIPAYVEAQIDRLLSPDPVDDVAAPDSASVTDAWPEALATEPGADSEED